VARPPVAQHEKPGHALAHRLDALEGAARVVAVMLLLRADDEHEFVGARACQTRPRSSRRLSSTTRSRRSSCATASPPTPANAAATATGSQRTTFAMLPPYDDRRTDVDAAGRRLHASGMTRSRRCRVSPLLVLCAALATAVPARAQEAPATTKVPLPSGALTAPAGWVHLDGAAITSATRPNDPGDPTAKALLEAVLGDLRRHGATEGHAVLHPGPNGPPLLVHAWTTDGAIEPATLLHPEHGPRVQATLEPHLHVLGSDVTLLAHERSLLFAEPGMVLRFRLVRSGEPFVFAHHIVPAGERAQYFETFHREGDDDARRAAEAVLRSFDGARPPTPDATTRNMLIGGLAGAIAGIATALLRRRRLLRQAAAGNAAGSDAATR
jgi:hypothetical protein